MILYVLTTFATITLNVNRCICVGTFKGDGSDFSVAKDINQLMHRSYQLPEKRHMSSLKDAFTLYRSRRVVNGFNYTWPVKHIAEIEGDVILGGLMMVHEREDRRICGPIMPQGGIQALECMLFTMDWVNNQKGFLPGFKLGAYVLDDCDKDTYGLEQAVDFIKGRENI